LFERDEFQVQSEIDQMSNMDRARRGAVESNCLMEKMNIWIKQEGEK